MKITRDWYYKNWRWFLLGCLFLATFLNYFDRQTLGIAIMPISEEFELTSIQRGNLLSAFLFTYAGTHLFIGFITDRIKNIRWFYPIMVIGWSLSTILIGIAKDYESVLWLRYILGVFEAVNFPIGIMIIARVFPLKERTLATGIFGSGAFLATLLAPKTVIFFSNNYDWRISFIFAGVLGVIWLIPWLLIFNHPSKRSAGWKDKANLVKHKSVGSPKEVLLNKGTWIVAVMGIGLIPCLYFATQWLPSYFTEALRLPYDQALGNKLSLIYFMMDAGLWIGGFMVFKLSQSGRSILTSRKMVISFAYVFILSILMVPHIENVNLVVAVFSFFVFGIGMFLANQHAFKQDVVVTQVAAVAALVGFIEMMFTAFIIKKIGIMTNISKDFGPVFIMLACFITVAMIIVYVFVKPKWFKVVESNIANE